MPDFGGTMNFRFSDGQKLSLRGQVSFDLNDQEFNPVVNSDGSISRSVTNTGYTVSLTFEEKKGFDWKKQYQKAIASFTLIEQTNGRQHVWSNCTLTGKPVADRMTGEITGVTMLARKYRNV